MSDDVLPDAPMAVIPGANDGILDDLLSPKSTFLEEHQPRSEQTSTFENFTDEQFHAMLAASCATPPPFETVNPSVLSSPGPATDYSGSDNSSPFHPVEYQLFNIRTSLSCPPTTDLLPLPAPTARRYSKHLSLHDGAYTEPHASPVGFPLNAQPPEPADEQSGMYFTLHRQLQERLMQEDDGNRNKHHQSQQPRAVVPAHNQTQHAGDPARYVRSPTPSPHPYPYAQQQHRTQQQQEFQPHPQQQQADNPNLPPQAQVTFHRQSGHFIGQPRPRRHPYPPAAPRQALPNAGGADGMGYAQQHFTPRKQGSGSSSSSSAVGNVNLLSCAGTVRIGTPVAPPPGLSRSATPMPHGHPQYPPRPPSTMATTSTASPTPSPLSGPAFSPVSSFGPGAVPTATSPPQYRREGGDSSGSNSGSNGSTTTTSRIRSNTAPTPSPARSRVRQAPYPSPAGPRSSSPFHPAATTLPHHPHHHPLHQQQQSIRGVERMAVMGGGHRRNGSGRSAGTPGPTSAPMMTMMSAAPRHLMLEHHLQHQRMWTPEPGGGGGAGDDSAGDAVAEGTGGGLRMAKRREQDTLVLGIQGIVERINRECDGLKEWVREAVEERGEGDEKGELERKRLEKRNKNFAVTKLDESLEPLPRSMQLETDLEDVPWDVPPNAQEIRNLDHDTITPLLEAYSIPFQSDMFLGQKKELYLRFVGVNRMLMHRVLD